MNSPKENIDIISKIPMNYIRNIISMFIEKYGVPPQIIIFNEELSKSLEGLSELSGCQVLFSRSVEFPHLCEIY